MTRHECHDPTIDVWVRLDSILNGENGCGTIYVYHLGPNDRPVKPYLNKVELSQGFLGWLQATHGSGQYRLLIRRGRKMIFSGNIGIG